MSRTDAGFSLLDALVATAILMVGVLSLAQLVALSMARNASARTTTMTQMLAEQKMEQLRADDLTPSPPRTLTADVTGWVDYLDAAGNLLNGRPTGPSGVVYIRRWAVDPVPGLAAQTLVLQVLVTSAGRGGIPLSSGLKRRPAETRLVSARTVSATS